MAARYGSPPPRLDGRSSRGSQHSGGRTFYPSSKDLSSSSSGGGGGHGSSRISRRHDEGSARRDPANLSSFYRDRFGSHSPEEYMNLRLSHMDPKLGKDEIKAILEKEFHSFAPFETKIVRNPHDDQRLAYVNFQRPEAARKIRKTMMSRLTRLLGHKLHVDPAGVIRDQEGKYIPDRYNRLQAERERRPSPPPQQRRRTPPPYDQQRSRLKQPAPPRTPPLPPPPRAREPPPPPPSAPTSRSKNKESSAQPAQPPVDMYEWKLNQCVAEGATRTLFIGNMPADIKDTEIKRVFERYGRVEDIDIKTPVDTNAAYAFVQFENLDQAMSAKYHEQDRPVRSNSSRSKIGYGKALVSNRLWVGGLGTWTSPDSLVREFDRYGLIDSIDYKQGADYAFVRFADASAASDACRAMRGFPLGGQDRCILVDFAKLAVLTNLLQSKSFIAVKMIVPRACSTTDLRSAGASISADSIPSADGKRKRSSPTNDQDRKKRKSSGRPKTPPLPPRRGPQTPPNSPPPSPPARREDREGLAAAATSCKSTDMKATTLEELEAAVSPCWTGALVLKKSAYAIRLHKLTGDDDLIDGHMRDDGGESIKLHVTQRLPFASQSGLVDRFASTPADQLAYLLAVANPNATAADLKLADSPSRPLKALVNYLNEKSAAGVVSARNGAVLYVFPSCDLADALLRTAAPRLTVLSTCADSCLLLALAKNGLKTAAESNGK